MGKIVPLISALFLVVAPIVLVANMAEPGVDGDLMTEPIPGPNPIEVVEEELTIDLRPLANRRPAEVRARYVLMNPGEERTLHLIFVAAAPDRGSSFDVQLNGASIPHADYDFVDLPGAWEIPRTTPPLEGTKAIPYEALVRRTSVNTTVPRDGSRLLDSVAGVRFTIVLPSGKHAVSVRYAAQPTGYGWSGPALRWQLGYLLAPAKVWSSFGKLHVNVLLPEGWIGASTPAMEQRGDTLIADWLEVPADALAITAGLPIPSKLELWARESLPMFATLVLGLILSLLTGRTTGYYVGKKGWHWIAGLPVVLGIGAIAVISTLAAFALESTLIKDAFGNQLNNAYTYGSGIGVVLLGVPAAFITGAAATWIAFYLARKRGIDNRLAAQETLAAS